MTRFGQITEPSRHSRSIETDSEHQCTLYKAQHKVLGLPWPSIDPIAFPCQADAQHIMPRTQDFLFSQFSLSVFQDDDIDDWSDFDDAPISSEEDYSVGEYLVTNKDDNIHKQRSSQRNHTSILVRGQENHVSP